MKSGNKRTSVALYGISRIDDPVHRTHAWRVSLRRHGKALVRNFPDRKFAGKRKALEAAKRYRDQLLQAYPPLSRVEFAKGPRKNNTSGVTGVCRVTSRYWLKDGREKHIFYWEAIWPTTPGHHVNQRFSVTQHGDAKAFELACSARRKGLRQVRGVFWAAERGEIQQAFE